MKFYLVVTYISIFCFSAFSQDSLLRYFNVDVSNNKVLINWTLNAGNTCNGTIIYRSSDSLNFYQIGNIQGTCGDLSNVTTYSFTDQSPIPNMKNYYKLDLGGIEHSEVRATELLIMNQNSYIIYPNPITNSSKIKFKNDNLNVVTLTVCNEFGQIVHTISGNTNFFNLDSDQFNTGMYFFKLVNDYDNSIILGHFVDNN